MNTKPVYDEIKLKKRGEMNMPVRKLWYVILCSLLLLGICGFCLAENQPGPPPDPAKMLADLKTGLDKLVANDVITTKQEETIIKYFKNMENNKNGGPPPSMGSKPKQDRNDPLSLLVKDGVITEEQAKAIQKILPKPPKPMDEEQ